MKDTSQISIDAFKTNVFIWEVIITIIVFGAAYFVLKRFKANEKASKKQNADYYTGND